MAAGASRGIERCSQRGKPDWAFHHELIAQGEIANRLKEMPIITLPGHRQTYPDSKVHGANMGPIWGRHDSGVPYVGPMDFAIWVE